MRNRPVRLLFIMLVGLLVALPLAARSAAPAPPVEDGVQAFLDAQPGPLKSFRDGDRPAAELISDVSAYYGVSPRILLSLLEATGALLSNPTPPDSALRQPFGAAGPSGFGAQLDWASRELRAGLGPYQRPPTLRFTDGATLTLTLDQAPEGVAVQRFLAKGRSQREWLAAVTRFGQAFERYFDNELPETRRPQQAASVGFLQRPWAAGTRVVHLAYFDHMYPTVDTGKDDNGYMVNYLGRGSVQYDGHDGHDYYFPDQPIGTYIYAAADGVAHASTHRGNGVWIEHAGGYVTVYWHLDKFAKKFEGLVDTGAGVAVRAGDLLGSSGKSGFVVGSPHLHFEVRHNGKQVDPYGWYGDGSDPCTQYAACEASVWLWHPSLSGEFDFTPPSTATPDDHTPPLAQLAIEPASDLLLLAHFDGSALPQVSAGAPVIAGGLDFLDARFGQGVRVAGGNQLALPSAGNLSLDAGTIAFWAQLPQTYPASPINRHYLLASSANADSNPAYTGTLALRRDLLGPNGSPRWNFWTTPDTGIPGRNDLTTPDTLAAGLHHFAISWDRAAGAKALYIDGQHVAATTGAELPTVIGPLIELGRWSAGAGASGVAFDELAIYGRALGPAELAQLALRDQPLNGSAAQVDHPNLRLQIKALDDVGPVVGLQLGVDGVWADPQPYAEQATLQLPASLGSYRVAARLVDRAGNSTVVSQTVTLAEPGQPLVELSAIDELGATLTIAQLPGAMAYEAQVSGLPGFAESAWQALPLAERWFWYAGQPRLIWVRARAPGGAPGPALVIGPDVRRTWLPVVSR